MSSLASRAIVWVKGILSITPPIVPPTYTSSHCQTNLACTQSASGYPSTCCCACATCRAARGELCAHPQGTGRSARRCGRR